jgi:hypothetical protein
VLVPTRICGGSQAATCSRASQGRGTKTTMERLDSILSTEIEQQQFVAVQDIQPDYATLRCIPRRTSAPGTSSSRATAALIASASGLVS